MNRNKLIFAAIFTVLLSIVGTVVMLEWFGPKRTIVLDVTGPAGSDLVGEVEVDGKLHAIDEKLPAKLTYEARGVAFALVATKDGARQQLSIRVLMEGEQQMSASGAGARGEIFKPTLPGMWWRYRAFITSQSNGKIHN